MCECVDSERFKITLGFHFSLINRHQLYDLCFQKITMTDGVIQLFAEIDLYSTQPHRIYPDNGKRIKKSIDKNARHAIVRFENISPIGMSRREV